MLESVLTVRWLDGDRVETVWRSRGDPDPGDRRFHSSSKPAGDRVHINAQVTTIWAADVPAVKRAIAVPVGGTALGDYRRRPAAAERASARRHSALYAEAEVGHEARRLQVTDSACPSGPRLSGSSPIHERCRSRYRGISRTARGTDARRNRHLLALGIRHAHLRVTGHSAVELPAHRGDETATIHEAAGRPRQAIAAGLLLSVVTLRWSGGVSCRGAARCRPSRRAAARRQ